MIGFRQIATRELPTWIDVFKADGMKKDEMLSELELIDDLLVLLKSKSLLNRKKNLKTQLEVRIGLELGHKPVNLNIR